MATQAIQNQTIVSVPQGRSDSWERVRDFFGYIGDTLGLYFNEAATIESLGHAQRSKMSVAERTELDVDLLGIRRF